MTPRQFSRKCTEHNGTSYVRTICGCACLSSDVSEIKLVFSIPPHRPSPNFAPSWNIAPTDPLPVVRYDAKAGERSVDVMRWGLVAFWAKDLKVGFSNINAKAEGIEGKPAFREAFQRRRCLVPVDNFYEWKKTATGKHAGEWVRSFAIITTTPNELCAELHNRMPVVLEPQVWPEWLGRGTGRRSTSKGPAHSLSGGGDDLLAVSTRVGNVKNNNSSLIEPVPFAA